MTRAGTALLEGDLLHSLRFHPMGLLLAAAAVTMVALALREGLTGRPVFRNTMRRHGTRAAILFLVLLVVVWVARLAVPRWSPDPIRPGSVAERVLPG
ncbi:MAG: DUF2752 domain-containing protein [Planctomycetota bacterium]|jgi:hypothetical protein